MLLLAWRVWNGSHRLRRECHSIEFFGHCRPTTKYSGLGMQPTATLSPSPPIGFRCQNAFGRIKRVVVVVLLLSDERMPTTTTKSSQKRQYYLQHKLPIACTSASAVVAAAANWLCTQLRRRKDHRRWLGESDDMITNHKHWTATNFCSTVYAWTGL